MQLTTSLDQNMRMLDGILRTDINFDMLKKDIQIAGVDGVLYTIDGFFKDSVLEKIMEFLEGLESSQFSLDNLDNFLKSKLPYVEISTYDDDQQLSDAVLMGQTAMLLDGFSKGIVLDLRTYPQRGIEEPDKEKVLRGSHDGFSETVVQNTCLIRRRIRTQKLTMRYISLGKMSKTDIVISYIEGLANAQLVEKIVQRLSEVSVRAATMSFESICEAVVGKNMWNPFPKVRYTERPDTASANILDGKIALIVDNSPTVMILPTCLLDFTQDIEDFYLPPFTGNYLRLIRNITTLLTMILTPIWLLLLQNEAALPSWLSFITIKEPIDLPVIVQLLILEVAIDGLLIASLNTPSTLSGAFSIIGGLLLGEFAVRAQVVVTESILFMAFVAIASYLEPSYELSYAIKFIRIGLLLLTHFFGLYGFIGGIILSIILAAASKTISGEHYLYPIIPFHWERLKSYLFRRKIKVYPKRK